MIDKADLRARFSAARRTRTAADIDTARTAIRAAILAEWSEDAPSCVAGYVPLRTEPGSVELLDALAARGIRVIVPVLLPDKDLDWALWRDESTGSLGADAITQADAVLVPALAVATNGTRLGRGGGSYDRALARVASGRPVVALLYEDELVPTLPADPWDRPVTAVATPGGWRNILIRHHS